MVRLSAVPFLFFGVFVVNAWSAEAQKSSSAPLADRFQVPSGFVMEQVAGPPLVRFPLFACFDDRGRLYVAEGTGTNLPGPELIPKKLGRITLLEDTDSDGRFDKSTIFADGLVFPQGVLWHDGVVYTASHPSIWHMQDTDGDDKADRIEPLVDGFRFTGNGCDIHGPFLGPDGRLYWTDGRHGYKINTREGTCLEGFAARIFRCRTDGSDLERLCGGGFDNPVELVFMPGGDLIGTMDQGPGDCLLHYVEGAVYPMDHPCISEFVMTGSLMPAVKQYTAALPVALCGIDRLRSEHWGPEFRDSLLTAQFNVHRIERHRLVREGSTYRSQETDFVTSSDYDVHFTDVLEDADGSVLIVDMGAWFNYGCPTSKIARPEVQGAIYRIKRAGVSRSNDPWGREVGLGSLAIVELIKLLDDPRPKVRDLAIAEVARRGDAAVEELANLDQSISSQSVELRCNLVWALSRIGSPAALAKIRDFLQDNDPTVRQAAANSAGLWRDKQAVGALTAMAMQEDPGLRRTAVEALGRMGNPATAASLFDCLRRGPVDRFLEHAVVYAVIRLEAVESAVAALRDPNPRVKQAALVALDQMPRSQLARDHVIPLLDTDDADLQQAVLSVMAKHPDWSRDAIQLIQQWLGAPALSPDQESSLTGLLLAFVKDPDVQALITTSLDVAPQPRRILLLRMLSRATLRPLPEVWMDSLGKSLAADDLSIRREALAVIKTRRLNEFDTQLVELSRDTKLPAATRVDAWDCVSAGQPTVPAEMFELLSSEIANPTEPIAAVTAARALGNSSLDVEQMLKTADLIASSGPLVVPLLMPAFSRTDKSEIGGALAAALLQSPGASALGMEELAKSLNRFPSETQAIIQPLRDKLETRQREQEKYLSQITLTLLSSPGNADRGREVFLSKKAACYACHRAAGQGATVGPDLSQVGRFRTTRDLLESIIYPSSSVVPHFRSFVIATKQGQVVTGLIVRETSDEIVVRTSQLAEIRIARQDIDEMNPSSQSIMPDGLDKTVSHQELADLLEFLFHQK